MGRRGEELLDAYPTIRRAVAFVELFMSANIYDGRDCFTEAINTGIGPAEMVRFCRDFASDEIALDEFGDKAAMKLARLEMEQPEFSTYVAGKMGAM